MIKKSNYFYEEEGDRETLKLVEREAKSQCIFPKAISREHKLYDGLGTNETYCYR